MKNSFKILTLSFVFGFLAGCGGGGGGGDGSLPKASLSTADCQGSYCGSLDNNSYSGNDIGIWRYTNNGNDMVDLNVSLKNVAYKDVMIVLTNEKSGAVSLKTSSSSGSGVSLNGKETEFISNKIFNDTPEYIRKFDAKAALQEAALNADKNIRRKTIAAKTWSVSEQSSWYIAPKMDNSQYTETRTATLQRQTTSGNRTINFWLENDEYASNKITNDTLNEIRDIFTNNIYGNVVSLAGEPWGDYAGYNNTIIEPNQQLNVVLINFDKNQKGDGLVGYFWMKNNMLNTPSSNEALVLFIDTEIIYLTHEGVKAALSTMAHELTHMINFYQRYISVSADNAYGEFLEELVAIMMEDVIGSKIDPSYNDVRDYNYLAWLINGRTGIYNCDFTDWDNYCKNQSYLNYQVSGSFGAYLLRHYGIGFYKQLLQYPMPNVSGNDRTRSISLLDRAIKEGTSNVEGLARAVQRWGAGISLFPANASPSGFGYPGISQQGFDLAAFNGADFASNRTLPSSKPTELKGYGHYPSFYRPTTNDFYQNVQVPRGVSATVIVK